MPPTNSFTDFPSETFSPPCCQTPIIQHSSLKPCEIDKSIKNLFKRSFDMVSRRCDKETTGTLCCSPIAQISDTAVIIRNVQPKSRSSKLFRCNFCSFVCTWAYDLSLHLRQKHGIHKKL